MKSCQSCNTTNLKYFVDCIFYREQDDTWYCSHGEGAGRSFLEHTFYKNKIEIQFDDILNENKLKKEIFSSDGIEINKHLIRDDIYCQICEEEGIGMPDERYFNHELTEYQFSYYCGNCEININFDYEL